MPASFWICAAVTVASSAVSFGFSIAGLRASTGVAVTPSRYAFARSLALFVVAVTAIFSGSVGFVLGVAVTMVIVQAVDAVIGVLGHSPMKTVGPAVTAALGLIAALWLLVS